MDKINKLDKTKTYVVMQVADSLIPKEIVKFSKKYCPDSKIIPYHVLAFQYHFNSWWIYESTNLPDKEYLINAGVRHYKIKTWLEKEKDNLDQYHFYQVDLDIEKLEEYIGQPYGMGDIRSLVIAYYNNKNGKQKDSVGLICSEYLAKCCEDIRKFYNLPANCITPAHWQNYVDKLGIKEVV